MASLPQNSTHYLAPRPDLRSALHSRQEPSDMVVYLNERGRLKEKGAAAKYVRRWMENPEILSSAYRRSLEPEVCIAYRHEPELLLNRGDLIEN